MKSKDWTLEFRVQLWCLGGVGKSQLSSSGATIVHESRGSCLSLELPGLLLSLHFRETMQMWGYDQVLGACRHAEVAVPTSATQTCTLQW